MYNIHTHIAYRKRNSDYIIKNLKNNQIYKLQFPSNVIWEGISQNFDAESICLQLEKMNINSTQQTFDLVIQEFLYENLIYENLVQKYNNEKYIFNAKNNMNEFINKASLIITDKCNFKCIHCYNKDYYNNESNCMSLEDWKKVIYDLKKLGCLDVMITGGEPFISPVIFDLLDFLEENNFSFDIITNGSLINDVYIKKMKKYNLLNSVTITLYGLSEYTYESITSQPIEIKRIIEIYNKMNDDNICTYLQYCYLTHNFNDATKIRDFENKNNLIIKKSYTPIFSSLNGISNENLNLNLTHLNLLYKNNCIEFNTNNDPTIKCGKERCAINFNGDVTICEKFQENTFGNIFKDRLIKIWNSLNIQEINCYSKLCVECKECVNKNYCIRCDGLSYVETKNPNMKVSYLCKLADQVKQITNS